MGKLAKLFHRVSMEIIGSSEDSSVVLEPGTLFVTVFAHFRTLSLGVGGTLWWFPR